jgi:hypothetical protein
VDIIKLKDLKNLPDEAVVSLRAKTQGSKPVTLTAAQVRYHLEGQNY